MNRAERLHPGVRSIDAEGQAASMLLWPVCVLFSALAFGRQGPQHGLGNRLAIPLGIDGVPGENREACRPAQGCLPPFRTPKHPSGDCRSTRNSAAIVALFSRPWPGQRSRCQGSRLRGPDRLELIATNGAGGEQVECLFNRGHGHIPFWYRSRLSPVTERNLLPRLRLSCRTTPCVGSTKN